eukprot:g19564.t1
MKKAASAASLPAAEPASPVLDASDCSAFRSALKEVASPFKSAMKSPGGKRRVSESALSRPSAAKKFKLNEESEELEEFFEPAAGSGNEQPAPPEADNETAFDPLEFLATLRSSYAPCYKVACVTKESETLKVRSCLEVAEADKKTETQVIKIPTHDEVKSNYRIDGSNCLHEIAYVEKGRSGHRDYLATLSVVPPHMHAGDFLQLFVRVCAKKKIRVIYACCRTELGPDTRRKHWHLPYTAHGAHRWQALKGSLEKELKRVRRELRAPGNPEDMHSPNFKDVQFEIGAAYVIQPGPKKPHCLYGEIYFFHDKDTIPRSLQSFADAQNKIKIQGMERAEFCETVIHLGFTSVAQGLYWSKSGKEAVDDGATLIDVLCAKAEAAEEDCQCGYYEFYEAVFRNSGYPNFKRTFAKHCVEGRGDRYCTIIVIGQGGSGKTHFITNPMLWLLSDRAFSMPLGKGSHLLAEVLTRAILALVFDEIILQRVRLLFGPEDGEGWYKSWLCLQTAKNFQVPVPQNNAQKYPNTLFSNPAPIICTTTNKLVIDEDLDPAIKPEQLDSEQEQGEERITYIHLRHKIRNKLAEEDGTGDWADVFPVDICLCCFSRLMRDGRDDYYKMKEVEKEELAAKKARWAAAREAAKAAAVKKEEGDN